MKYSLSRIAALSLALGLATSTASFASDIRVLKSLNLPENLELKAYRELIEERYSDCTLSALTQKDAANSNLLCSAFINLCFNDPAGLFANNTLSPREWEAGAKTFVGLYNIICGRAMRSTQHRIYIVIDEKTKIVNLYMQRMRTKCDPVAECIGQLFKEKGKKTKLCIKPEAWAKLPHWKAPFVVTGPRQDAADFISAMEAEEPPVGACYLDGARAGLLAELALSRVIPGKEFQDASLSDRGIFMFFPNQDVLMDAVINNHKPDEEYLKSLEMAKKKAKKKIDQNLQVLETELFAEKNLKIFDGAAWAAYGDSSKYRRFKAFCDYRCVRKQVGSDTFWNNTDAVFTGDGSFYTLMRALWDVAENPDKELRSSMEKIEAEEATKSTGELCVEELSVIKGRIQHLAEEYGLTNEAQDAAAFIVQPCKSGVLTAAAHSALSCSALS